MPLKLLIKRFLPFATKQRALAIINPVLQSFITNRGVRSSLSRRLGKHRIEYLDVGGWMAVEDYLTLHLSSVEPYGIPQAPKTTMQPVFDEGAALPRVEVRPLKAPAVTLHFDILSGIPLSDESMLGVNLSHVFEHFDLETGRGILRECHRVLRPGGILRVSCPDLRKYAQAYLNGDDAFFRRVSTPAFCNYRNLPSYGAVFAGKAYDAHNGHKWFYDAKTVAVLCEQAGFSKTMECELHYSSLPHIADIEPSYRAVESFYMEAVR